MECNSQYEHGQSLEQTRNLSCTCNSGVARCQSQHQCHIWRLNSLFEANYTGKWTWQLLVKFCVVHEAMNGCKNLKKSLKAYFENVNVWKITCDPSI